MTPRQRKILYGKTYHYLTNGNERYNFLCDAFTRVTGRENVDWDKELPEFGLFKNDPPISYGAHTGDRVGWWDDDDKEVRLIAILLCKEMVKSKL